MILHIGNLAPKTAPAELRKKFEAHGRVSAVSVPPHAAMGGRAAGPAGAFAYVTLPDPGEANAAMKALNGKELFGRVVTVKKALAGRPRRRS
jgi:RNA recognition motif-containing protein